MTRLIKFIGIIPARYASSRFPGKPLAVIYGKTMIRRVYEQASKALETVYVATDDQRIYDEVKAFGGRVAMTSENHRSGTDRCAEAMEIAEAEMKTNFDVVMNIQGDEPFIEPGQIEQVKSCFADKSTEIATLVKKIDSVETLFDANRPKVVINSNNKALYFSRSVIPFVRGIEKEQWLNHRTFYMHIGLYGYRRDILPRLTALEQSPLEVAESLEQLRWIENGFSISVAVTDYESFGVDTPGDLEKLVGSRE